MSKVMQIGSGVLKTWETLSDMEENGFLSEFHASGSGYEMLSDVKTYR